jgi:hypothetical protein
MGAARSEESWVIYEQVVLRVRYGILPGEKTQQSVQVGCLGLSYSD